MAECRASNSNSGRGLDNSTNGCVSHVLTIEIDPPTHLGPRWRPAAASQSRSSSPGVGNLVVRSLPLESRVFGFLDLPAEVRIIVYGYVIGNDTRSVHKLYSYEWREKLVHPQFQDTLAFSLKLPKGPRGIALTCQQISGEILELLYGKCRPAVESGLDHAEAFQAVFGLSINTHTVHTMKHLQMDVPHDLRVKTDLVMPLYVELLIKGLPNLELVILTISHLRIPNQTSLAWKWKDCCPLLRTAAAVAVAHKTLKRAVWTETLVPHARYRRLDSTKLKVKITDPARIKSERMRAQCRRELILDCAAICSASWETLSSTADLKAWAVTSKAQELADKVIAARVRAERN